MFPKIFLLHKVVRDAEKVEKHWSSQPTPFIIFWQVLRNNSWTSNKHNEKKNKNKKRMNEEHGEENVQVKPHAYVHRWVDRI